MRWLGKGSVVAAFSGQIGAAARAFFPNVLYEPPTTFKLDKPDDYPQGYTFDPEHRLFVIRQNPTSFTSFRRYAPIWDAPSNGAATSSTAPATAAASVPTAA